MNSSDTNEQVYIADFSSLKTPGTYYIAVPNLGKSVSFKVASNVYNETFKTSMLAMYLWRCNPPYLQPIMVIHSHTRPAT
jgi:endoglucanase